MKYSEPKMNITIFNTENVVTASGATDPTPKPKTALEYAREEVNSNGYSTSGVSASSAIPFELWY